MIFNFHQGQISVLQPVHLLRLVMAYHRCDRVTLLVCYCHGPVTTSRNPPLRSSHHKLAYKCADWKAIVGCKTLRVTHGNPICGCWHDRGTMWPVFDHTWVCTTPNPLCKDEAYLYPKCVRYLYPRSSTVEWCRQVDELIGENGKEIETEG
jgi:hypothetical protein